MSDFSEELDQFKKEEERYWLERDFVMDLLKQLPTHVFWKNADLVFLGCNDTFAKALGFSSADEIVGKTDYDLPVKKEQGDIFRADDRQIMESGQPKLNIEEERTFLDGRKAFLLTNKVPLVNKKNNKTMGILGVFNDITELKKDRKK